MAINKINGRINKITSITFIIFIIFINVIIRPKTATAQTLSLSIWPPILEAVIQPGKAITQVYKLQNLGDDVIIKASIVPFEPADELGRITLKKSDPIPDFFSLQNANLPELPATFPLKSGQTQELVLKISLPASAIEADYPVAFLFESTAQGLISGSGTTTLASIGSNILLTVSRTGQLSPLAKIAQFSAKLIYDSFEPISFQLLLQNTSSTRLKAVGQIEIKNIFGGVSATIPLREDNVLANSSRQLQPETNVPSLIFGRFTAKASITPKDTTNTISQTLTFYVLPYKILLAVFILSAILLLTKNKLKHHNESK
ncbi:MAG: hypothetical protein NTZ93_00060 [Candidatus Beckwithbacteria bacterium]|nr:hypothetical protein [Candidatus Beckwithbacteria bacterium]